MILINRLLIILSLFALINCSKLIKKYESFENECKSLHLKKNGACICDLQSSKLDIYGNYLFFFYHLNLDSDFSFEKKKKNKPKKFFFFLKKKKHHFPQSSHQLHK